MKIYISTHRGYEIYSLNSLLECPRLGLYDYLSEAALVRAITRALTTKRRKAS
jgi:hypothetical protein